MGLTESLSFGMSPRYKAVSDATLYLLFHSPGVGHLGCVPYSATVHIQLS